MRIVCSQELCYGTLVWNKQRRAYQCDRCKKFEREPRREKRYSIPNPKRRELNSPERRMLVAKEFGQ